MSAEFMAITPELAMCAAAGAIALGAPASAEPDSGSCGNSGLAVVYEKPGSASFVTAPPTNSNSCRVGGGVNEQNGTYGPAGALPPVGSN